MTKTDTYWSIKKKSFFISLMFELIFSWVLVKTFGNHYQGENILGDILVLILILWGIQVLLSIKDLISWYINFKLNEKQLIDMEFST